MYVAAQFNLDPDAAVAWAARIGAGQFITCGERGIDATFLPFNIARRADGKLALHTHCAKVNPQWRDAGECLVTVTGPNCYVSPSDMTRAAPDARMPRVPTWNYLTIQIRGRLVAHHDSDWKIRTLAELSRAHEPEWSPGACGAGTESGAGVAPMLKALVGIEVVVDDVVGKAKLSQNRSSEDISYTAGNLRARARDAARRAVAAGTNSEAILERAGEAADLSEMRVDHSFEHPGAVADLMERIAIPWAIEREARVAEAREIQRLRDEGR